MSKNEFICDCNIIHQDVVDKALKQMPEEDSFNKIAEFFKILGDTTRTKILFALDENEMSLLDTEENLFLPRQGEFHLDHQQYIVVILVYGYQTLLYS